MGANKGPDSARISIAWQDPAMMQIGKSGLSQGTIKEAKRLLKKHKYVKIRLLRSAVAMDSKEQVFKSLAEWTGATLVGIRGNTGVLYKL